MKKLTKHIDVFIIIILKLSLLLSITTPLPNIHAEKQPQVVVSQIGDTPLVIAGDEFNDTINLKNVGDESASNVQIVIDIKHPFTLVNMSSNIYYGNIGPGKSKTKTITFSIDRKALVGVYYISFKIIWYDDIYRKFEDTSIFNVQVVDRPQITILEMFVEGNTSTVLAGESFTKDVVLTNKGFEDARNVKLQIHIKYPFTLLRGSTNLFFGTLDNSENKSFSIHVTVDRNAVGVYSIPFLILYEDSYGWNYNTTGQFGVEVLGRPQTLIFETIRSVERSIVYTGNTLSKTFNLTNIGGYHTKRVQLSLNVTYPFALTSSSSNLLFGDIRIGESKSMSFNLTVDRKADVGVHSIPYIISYENAFGDRYTKQGDFGIEIVGRPTLLIDEIRMEPSTITKGQSGLLNIILTNIGTDLAFDTSIRIFGGSDIISSSFTYIAKIEDQKSKSFYFPISIGEETSHGNYLLNITISYKDYLANKHYVSKLYEMEVLPKSSIVPPFYIGLAAVLAALAFFGYSIYSWNTVNNSKEGMKDDHE